MLGFWYWTDPHSEKFNNAIGNELNLAVRAPYLISFGELIESSTFHSPPKYVRKQGQNPLCPGIDEKPLFDDETLEFVEVIEGDSDPIASIVFDFVLDLPHSTLHGSTGQVMNDTTSRK
jgi:hypothetical protein